MVFAEDVRFLTYHTNIFLWNYWIDYKMTVKLQIKDVYKIFGNSPKTALEMVNSGMTKDEIYKKTGNTIGVAGASFEVNQGEIFVVMGLSGSGKSTLVRLLNRLIEPTSGEILLDGKDIMKMDVDQLRNMRRRDMSMVFQSFALMPHHTVLQNAAFGLEIAGIGKAQREAAALEALEQVGLAERASSYPSELSGGMRQRVGLARALANNPTIMLMDEAFSALDPLIRTEMQDELLRLQAEHERTVIFISHDLDEAMRIGDRIAIMEGGRVVQVGTPDEILQNPADDYVESFFRGVNLSQVYTAGQIARQSQVTLIDRSAHGVRTALRRLEEYDREFGYLIGKKKEFHGVVSIDSLRGAINDKKNDSHLIDAILDDVPIVAEDDSLNDIMGTVASCPYAVPVVNSNNIYKGAISRAVLLRTLDSGPLQ